MNASLRDMMTAKLDRLNATLEDLEATVALYWANDPESPALVDHLATLDRTYDDIAELEAELATL